MAPPPKRKKATEQMKTRTSKINVVKTIEKGVLMTNSAANTSQKKASKSRTVKNNAHSEFDVRSGTESPSMSYDSGADPDIIVRTTVPALTNRLPPPNQTYPSTSKDISMELDTSLSPMHLPNQQNTDKNVNQDEHSQIMNNSGDSDIEGMPVSNCDPPAGRNYVQKQKKSKPSQNKKNAAVQETLEKLHQKFKRDVESQKGQCLLNDCRSKSITWRPYNLKRHLKQMHASEFTKLFGEKQNEEIATRIELFNAIQDAVELVSVNGMPLSILNASGMRGFIMSRLNSLRSHGYQISLNRWNIIEEVEKSLVYIVDRMKAEMNGKLVNVMYDIATKGTLSVLGINVTYMVNNEVVCRSLGIEQINERHNAVNLADMIFDILEKFGVSLSSVFTTISDNAKNVVNCSAILDLVARSNSDSTLEENESMQTDQFSTERMDDDEEREDQLSDIMSNAYRYTEMLDDVSQDYFVRKNNEIVSINHINCGTHTLQLGINDAIDASDAKSTLDEAREICKSMRSQVVMIEFRKIAGQKLLPPLDNSTRWNSKYVMARDLLKIRNIVDLLSQNKEFGKKFAVREGFWAELTEIVDVLKIPYIATVESQKVGYGLSDFFISWLRIRKALERICATTIIDLATKLMDRLDQRAPQIFKTPLLLCSVYLDPRINFKLSAAQKRDAALQLLKVYKRINSLNHVAERTVNDTLDEIQAEYLANTDQQDCNETNFLNSLARFEEEKAYDIRAAATDFWKLNGHKYPQVLDVAEVILSVPANQCCTERAFSSFTFIRSARRTSISPKNLSNLLMIRLNKDLFYDFRNEQVQKIRDS